MIKAEVYKTGERLEKEMERWGISDQYFELLTNLVTQAAMATDTDLRLEVVERIRKIITDAGSLDFPQINARDIIGMQYHDLLYRLNCIESEIKQEAGDV
jgi:hypothetical protein